MLQKSRFEGVHQLRLARSFGGRGIYFTGAFWVDGLLIDTGAAHTRDELLTGLGDLPVRQVVITHAHEDHIGGNAAVSRKYKAPIMAHENGLAVLANPRAHLRLKPYQHLLWGVPEPCPAGPVNQRIETGHHVFEVLFTPGHSRDHICLFEPEKGWVFSGDLFVGGKDQVSRAGAGMPQVIASLKKLAALKPRVIFPAGGKIRVHPGQELEEKISYLDHLGDQARDLWVRGLSYGAISRKLFGKPPAIAWMTLGDFSGKHLVRSLVEDRPSTE